MWGFINILLFYVIQVMEVHGAMWLAITLLVNQLQLYLTALLYPYHHDNSWYLELAR